MNQVPNRFPLLILAGWLLMSPSSSALASPLPWLVQEKVDHRSLIFAVHDFSRAGEKNLHGKQSVKDLQAAFAPLGPLDVVEDFEATTSKFLETLAQYRSQVNRGGSVIVSIISHGTRDGRIVTSESSESWLTVKQIKASVKPLVQSGISVTLIIDACHSSGIGDFSQAGLGVSGVRTGASTAPARTVIDTWKAQPDPILDQEKRDVFIDQGKADGYLTIIAAAKRDQYAWSAKDGNPLSSTLARVFSENRLLQADDLFQKVKTEVAAMGKQDRWKFAMQREGLEPSEWMEPQFYGVESRALGEGTGTEMLPALEYMLNGENLPVTPLAVNLLVSQDGKSQLSDRGAKAEVQKNVSRYAVQVDMPAEGWLFALEAFPANSGTDLGERVQVLGFETAELPQPGAGREAKIMEIAKKPKGLHRFPTKTDQAYFLDDSGEYTQLYIAFFSERDARAFARRISTIEALGNPKAILGNQVELLRSNVTSFITENAVRAGIIKMTSKD